MSFPCRTSVIGPWKLPRTVRFRGRGAQSSGTSVRRRRSPEPRSIEITARRFAFEPAEVNGDGRRAPATGGRSADGVHGLEIKKLKIKKEIPRGGEPVTIDFTATTEGSFPILCSEVLRQRPRRHDRHADRPQRREREPMSGAHRSSCSSSCCSRWHRQARAQAGQNPPACPRRRHRSRSESVAAGLHARQSADDAAAAAVQERVPRHPPVQAVRSARATSATLAGDLFGLDNGAIIGLEYRFGLMRGLQAGLLRTQRQDDRVLRAVQRAEPAERRGRSASASWHRSTAPTTSATATRRRSAWRCRASSAITARVYVEPIWVNNSNLVDLPGDDNVVPGRARRAGARAPDRLSRRRVHPARGLLTWRASGVVRPREARRRACVPAESLQRLRQHHRSAGARRHVERRWTGSHLGSSTFQRKSPVWRMRIRILGTVIVVTGLIFGFAACGGSDSPTAPGGNDGTIAATITIDATGNVTPKDVTVPAGSRVTFTNNHTRLHEMMSDPHPEHTLCPSLNIVGIPAPPARASTSSNLNTPMVVHLPRPHQRHERRISRERFACSNARPPQGGRYSRRLSGLAARARRRHAGPAS